MNPKTSSTLMFLAAAVLPATAAAQGRITYCCIGSDGKQVCSDVLPQQCYGKPYREINSRGITVRRVDAPLTEEQRAAREAEARKAREAEDRKKEQDRKDRALLATYASEQEIDHMRDRSITDSQKIIKAAQAKLAELARQRQKLDNEAEFYKKKTPPPALQSRLRDNDIEMKAQQAIIDGKQKDIEANRAKYDEEKLRYRELTKAGQAGRGGAAAQAPAESRPR